LYWFLAVEALILCSSGAGFFLAWYAWRQRAIPGSAYFSVIMAGMALYSLSVACELASSGIPAKILWSKIQYLFTAAFAPLWLHFALSFGQYGDWSKRRGLAVIWLLPVVVLALVWTNERHGLAWPDVYPIPNHPAGLVVYEHGPAVWALVAYSYLLLLMGWGLLLHKAYRSAHLYRSQMAALLAAVVVPLAVNMIYLSGTYEGFDLSSLVFVASGAVIIWAILRLRLLRVLPIAYDAMLANMRDGLVLVDAQGRLVDVNAAANTLLRLPPDAIGRDAGEVLHAWPALLGLKDDAIEISIPAAPETTRWLEAGVTPLRNARGANLGRLLLVRDISERKNAEEARRRLDAQLVQAQKVESLGVLAGGIAHDFNNMLMVIRGNIELAVAELPADASVRDHLEVVNATVERAAELARHMLAYAGKVHIRLARVDLSEVVRHVAPMVRVVVPDPITVRWELAEGLPHAQIDVVQMRQVVMNLVRNAVEAIDTRPGVIVLRTGEQNGPEERCVFLEVADTGPGIDPSVIDRVFDPFFTTKFIGRGLGLAAALGVVRSHNGTVEVTSVPGQGAKFRVSLPVETTA